MKTFLPKIGVFFIIMLLFNTLLFSQKKSELSIGFGYPKMICIKMKYGINFQTGLSFGFFPVKHEVYRPDNTVNIISNTNLWSYVLDFSYHFPKIAGDTTSGTWYLNSGFILLNYVNITSVYDYGGYAHYRNDDRRLLVFTKAGRTMNFKNNTGINLDIGPGLQIAPKVDNSIHTSPGGNHYSNYVNPWRLAASISYFVRF
jgi:hypothetical protein